MNVIILRYPKAICKGPVKQGSLLVLSPQGKVVAVPPLVLPLCFAPLGQRLYVALPFRATKGAKPKGVKPFVAPSFTPQRGYGKANRRG